MLIKYSSRKEEKECEEIVCFFFFALLFPDLITFNFEFLLHQVRLEWLVFLFDFSTHGGWVVQVFTYVRHQFFHLLCFPFKNTVLVFIQLNRYFYYFLTISSSGWFAYMFCAYYLIWFDLMNLKVWFSNWL